MNKPLVSVILPTYNRALLLPRAINSILSQTYKDFELIIIDDNSSDKTQQIIQRCKDPRVNYIKHKMNKGGAAARNTGIRIARGEYIAFQDSDDEWLPEKLNKHINMFEKLPAGYGVIYSDCLVKEENREYAISSLYRQLTGDISKAILKGNFITIQTIIRRKCFENCGDFDVQLSRMQDWELWIRVSKKYKFNYIPEIFTIIHRQRANSITSNLASLSVSMEYILEKHKVAYLKNTEAYGKRLNILADVYARSGDKLQAEHYFRKALFYNKNLKVLLPYLLMELFGTKVYCRVLNNFIRYH